MDTLSFFIHLGENPIIGFIPETCCLIQSDLVPQFKLSIFSKTNQMYVVVLRMHIEDYALVLILAISLNWNQHLLLKAFLSLIFLLVSDEKQLHLLGLEVPKFQDFLNSSSFLLKNQLILF